MFRFTRTGREKTDWILLPHKMTSDLALLRTPICPQLCGIPSKMSNVSSFLPLESSSAQLWLRTMTPLEAGKNKLFFFMKYPKTSMWQRSIRAKPCQRETERNNPACLGGVVTSGRAASGQSGAAGRLTAKT